MAVVVRNGSRWRKYMCVWEGGGEEDVGERGREGRNTHID